MRRSRLVAAFSFCGIIVLLDGKASAQGLAVIGNSARTLFLTNSIAIGGGSGPMLGVDGPFYFQTLTAPSNVVSVDVSLQQLLSSPWSDTGLRGTNTTAGREVGNTISLGSPNPVVNFWPASQTNSFIVIGWSANLGTTWAQIATELAGASLLAQNGGFVWQGGGLVSSDGRPAFLGATTVGFRQAGGVAGNVTIPTPLLFASSDDAQGQPVTTMTSLWIVAPEPSVFALALVGFGALMAQGARGKR